MYIDEDLKLFIIIVFSVFILNAVFIGLGKHFLSKKPSQTEGGQPTRRSVPLAMFFYLLILVIDAVFIFWLFGDGKALISSFLNLDFLDNFT